MKYRKKPVEIEALKWTGKNQVEMFNFIYNGSNPDKAILSTKDKDFFISHCDCEGGLVIKTLEGRHIATIGDYIIKGVKGEFYPCKPAIFAMTYDAL